MSYEIIEAKPYHVGQIVRQMRADHRQAMLGLCPGQNLHRDLHEMFIDSSIKKAGLIDGKLAALWGVSGVTMATTGNIWLVLTDQAVRFPAIVARVCKRELDCILRVKTEIHTAIILADEKSVRLAEFLGFEITFDDKGEIGAAVLRRRPAVDLRNFHSQTRH